MSGRSDTRVRFPFNVLAAVAIVMSLLLVGSVQTAPGASAQAVAPFCSTHIQLCTEPTQPWNYRGQYIGHDEPSLLFYSSKPGSGNSNLYHLTLPTEPTNAPKPDGTGATWNFMLHPAFWFGMALCDDQSAPSPGKACTPDSDSNIYTSTNPSSANWLGNTPGTAFLEMQFYPPGWGGVGSGVSCGPDSTQWCAALNIDSLSEDYNAGTINNNDCLNNAGFEYVNYAIITKDGVPNGPPAPGEQTINTFETSPDTLEMNPGDNVTVSLHDTTNGLQVVINDQTTGQSGSMTASAANGFGHPLYQPNASTCTIQHYTFHPMYSTSSPNTRVLWAAHSYNVAYSDEIGHFEYCNRIDHFGNCKSAGVTDPSGTDGDDSACYTDPLSLVAGNPSFNGCLNSDGDFDGPEYQHNWPGSDPNHASDLANHGTPITFSSPLFTSPSGGLQNYSQAAFETDLPRIEGADSSPNNDCQRHVTNPTDPSPGTGCVNPPNGASFYPIYMTANVNGQCMWEEGDVNLPGVTNTFGGTSAAEYGPLLVNNYPAPGGQLQQIYENFHNTLSNNPCPSS